MLQIFLFSFLTSIQIIIFGYLFHLLFVDKHEINKNIFFYGLLGFIFIGFLGVVLNFFISLNKYVNDLFFVFPLLTFLILYFDKEFIKKVFLSSLIISIFFTLTISFDNHYTPDAGSYHLPFISILNENKIIIGLNNLHYRFGHISIFQYISAFYNNHLFEDNGISIPLGLVYCFFVGYLIIEILNNQTNKFLYIFIFIILSFVLFRMNRYSDLGNDGPANIFFFFLIIESIKSYILIYKIKITSVLSVFVFLNKITLLLALFIPIFFVFKNFKINSFINKTNIFSFIFLTFFLLKNFLVSGCLAFPIEQSCYQNVFWFNDNNKYSVKFVRAENEAWTKGWPDQVEPKKNHFEYISDLGWIDTWRANHGKVIVKKISPFLIFMLIIILTLCFHNRKNSYFKNNNNKNIDDLIYYYLITICLIGTLLWFLKFPVFRYGYSYFITLFGLIISMSLKNLTIFNNLEKLKKGLLVIFIILICGVSTKNLSRIISNLKNQTLINVWPRIYPPDEIKPVFRNSKLLFYKNEKNTCYYSKSPCTHLLEFELNDLNQKELYSYKIFYFN